MCPRLLLCRLLDLDAQPIFPFEVPCCPVTAGVLPAAAQYLANHRLNPKTSQVILHLWDVEHVPNSGVDLSIHGFRMDCRFEADN